ncbi:hypothetical protein PCANC_15229 [Puccinia coronata f. sp. avenae]|uniref:Uncharacterized protein n=1 Tax=Puccinia coronata f. sp. avenae TaxID=200324 RepID=A0A2N5S1X9_9BASI|nr:hypothetical protein PCANC_26321 [Puccinia coronata f. sp. avenae]PLW18941.1 hypothetical protein PCASD_22735 [Puccinia coronata f. sp. avenae]PLW50014.1 hypothetical protein PCASD_01235 [Puccinia coronata f. sp. avenae]PLW51562.1 hypothetical protein PCANC_15229 [Puccinia coronata f. sp. avenae]
MSCESVALSNPARLQDQGAGTTNLINRKADRASHAHSACRRPARPVQFVVVDCETDGSEPGHGIVVAHRITF